LGFDTFRVSISHPELPRLEKSMVKYKRWN
jgi:hypothetical protein